MSWLPKQISSGPALRAITCHLSNMHVLPVRTEHYVFHDIHENDRSIDTDINAADLILRSPTLDNLQLQLP